jgi:Tat protein secretion system quality control protein TatD with DNase activity
MILRSFFWLIDMIEPLLFHTLLSKTFFELYSLYNLSKIFYLFILISYHITYAVFIHKRQLHSLLVSSLSKTTKSHGWRGERLRQLKLEMNECGLGFGMLSK